MDQISAILKVNGSLPRRAVLLEDGRLADRTACTTCREVDLLSRLCEVVRSARGLAVYPRRCEDLLQLALSTNDEGAWAAIRDDIVTGDLDMGVCCAVLGQSSNAAVLAGCLVGARGQRHLMHVCCLLARALPRPELGAETREEMARALACQLRPLVDALLVHGEDMSLDVRDACLDGLGGLLQASALPVAGVAEAVLHALDRGRDELLRLFLGMPPTFVEHRPQILPALLARLAAPAPLGTSRYPPLELLARLAEHDASALRGSEREVAAVAAGCLGGEELDARACLAVARIALALGVTCHEPLAGRMAAALRDTSAWVVRGGPDRGGSRAI